MKKQLPAWLALGMIALIAGLLLGLTNNMTADRIDEQTKLAAEAARRAVLPEAAEFVEMTPAEDAKVDNCYEGTANGSVVGYTAQATVPGYGGDIEVTVGMNAQGVVTGVNVGGANFAETAGLGAKTKDAAFRDQFAGITPPAVAGGNVDAISGATISSNAVISAVNAATEYIGVTHLGLEVESAVDNYWEEDGGLVVQVTKQGFAGPITVLVKIGADGTVTSVEISSEGFNETAGIGARVLEPDYLNRFAGISGSVAIGQGVDALSGATISSTAVTEAVNEALQFAATVQ